MIIFKIIYVFILFFVSLLRSDVYDSTLVISALSSTSSLDSNYPEIFDLDPNGGEEYISGEVIQVNWDAYDESFTDSSISISISYFMGAPYTYTHNDLENTGQETIEIDDVNSQFVRVKLSAIDFYGNYSERLSDNYFTVGYNSNWEYEPPMWTFEDEETIEVSYDQSFLSDLLEVDSEYPILNILSPNGGEAYQSSDQIIVEYDSEDETFSDSALSIYLSPELGYPYDFLGNFSDIGTAYVDLPSIDSFFARLKMTAEDGYGNQSIDYTDDYFQIGTPESYSDNFSYDFIPESYDSLMNIDSASYPSILDSELPYIQWIYPNGGEQLQSGDTIGATWDGQDSSFQDSSITISLSTDLGSSYNQIISNIPNLMEISIELPPEEYQFCRFMIEAQDSFGNYSYDYSDEYFEIGFQCSSNILGDFNGDQAVNIYDIVIIVQCVLNSSCDTCSDINQDLSVDIIDIIELVNIILNS